jgi:hypothetical protein
MAIPSRLKVVQPTEGEGILKHLEDGFLPIRKNLLAIANQRDEELKAAVALAYHCMVIIKQNPGLNSKFSEELSHYHVSGLYHKIITRFLALPDELKGKRSSKQRSDINNLFEKRDLMANALEWLHEL